MKIKVLKNFPGDIHMGADGEYRWDHGSPVDWDALRDAGYVEILDGVQEKVEESIRDLIQKMEEAGVEAAPNAVPEWKHDAATGEMRLTIRVVPKS